MSRTISIKVSDAIYHTLNDQMLKDGNAGSITAARAVFIRKAIKYALNKAGWQATLLELDDADYQNMLQELPEVASEYAEGAEA